MLETISLVESFLKSCETKGLTSRSIYFYANILKTFSKLYPILPDNPEICESFISSCKAGDERRHGYFRTLRAFFRFAEKRFSVKNAMSIVPAPKRKKKLPRPVPIDYMVQLISFPLPARVKASIIFITDTGVRVGELANIQPADFIKTDLGYIVPVSGKTGPRIVPVSDEAYNAVIKHLPLNISANRLSRIISQAFRDANVPGSAHGLRHSFGTYWQGEDLSILQKIMGHASINTTMIYREVQYEKELKAHKIYSPLKMILSRLNNTDIM